jgi:hypothetical protein
MAMKQFLHVQLKTAKDVVSVVMEGREVLLDQSPGLPQMSAPIPVVWARDVDGVTFVQDRATREYPLSGSFYCYCNGIVEVPA